MSYYGKTFVDFINKVDHMPVYNRSHVQNKCRSDESIALSTHKKQVFLEKEINPDDTLQSVAIEFNVPVSELKRINNIHKDNEIYARKILKVPSNPLSILLEREYFVEPKKTRITNQQTNEGNCNVIIETVNNSTSVPKDCIDDITEQQDKFLCTSIPTEEQESASLLNSTLDSKQNEVMSCNGADWGISWHALLLFILILGLGGPFLYVFWLLWGRKGKALAS